MANDDGKNSPREFNDTLDREDAANAENVIMKRQEHTTQKTSWRAVKKKQKNMAFCGDDVDDHHLYGNNYGKSTIPWLSLEGQHHALSKALKRQCAGNGSPYVKESSCSD